MANLIPTNDAERHAIVYRAMETPIKELLVRIADETADILLKRIRAILKAAGYEGWETASVLQRPAPVEAVLEMERLAESLPEAPRRRLMSRMFGQIGNGTLTVRKAVREVAEFGHFALSPKLYNEGKKRVREVAQEAYLRGEYTVQKQVGIGWEVEVPGIKEVDSFVKGRWSQSEVTDYLKPVGKMMKDTIEESLALGESPHVMARRMEQVHHVDRVRAERSARTIVTAVSNDCHAEAYKKHGVKRYEFVCTFDERTCPVCGRLDGKTFPMDSKETGVNYPPMHPNCRCTTVAALSKELKEKLYKDFEVHNKDGTVTRMDARITYEEWAADNVKH